MLLDLVPTKKIALNSQFVERMKRYGVYKFCPQKEEISFGGRAFFYGSEGYVFYPDVDNNIGRVERYRIDPSPTMEAIFATEFDTKVMLGVRSPGVEENAHYAKKNREYQLFLVSELKKEISDGPDWNFDGRGHRIWFGIGRVALSIEPALADIGNEEILYKKIDAQYCDLQALFRIRFVFDPPRDRGYEFVEEAIHYIQQQFPGLKSDETRLEIKRRLPKQEAKFLSWITEHFEFLKMSIAASTPPRHL